MSGSMSSLRGALHIPTKKRSGGGGGGAQFATRVPCNPENSVGLQAVLMEPAWAHLHVTEPIRLSARRITLLAVTMSSSSPFCIDSYSLLCNLCDRRMDDCVIYMYMSMGFCTEECRNEYFLDYRYRLAVAMAMEAETRKTRSEARNAAELEGEAATGYRRIFFTCAEIEYVFPLGIVAC